MGNGQQGTRSSRRAWGLPSEDPIWNMRGREMRDVRKLRMQDTYTRAIHVMEQLTCLMPGCCVCTNIVKDEIDAAIAEALEHAQHSPSDVSEGVNPNQDQ